MNNPHTQAGLNSCEAEGRAESRPPTDRGARYSVENVEGRLGAFDSATVINVSLGGMAIETHKYLQVGSSCPLRFDRSGRLLVFNAIVVWSQLIRTVAVGKNEVRPVYRAGLRFSDLSAAQKEEVEAFVHDEVARAVEAPSGEEAEARIEFARTLRTSKDVDLVDPGAVGTIR